MSTYEKIILAVIGVLLMVMVFFSYHEFKEPAEETSEQRESSNFDKSLGQDFKVGPFVTVVNTEASGGLEDNCEAMQPNIIAALHDIKEYFVSQKAPSYSFEAGDTFEVNDATLTFLCNKNAEITLADTDGNKLVLKKIPFIRAVPKGGSAADIGTEVRINATVIPVGGEASLKPTTFGDILIPDRFLDTATSSPS